MESLCFTLTAAARFALTLFYFFAFCFFPLFTFAFTFTLHKSPFCFCYYYKSMLFTFALFAMPYLLLPTRFCHHFLPTSLFTFPHCILLCENFCFTTTLHYFTCGTGGGVRVFSPSTFSIHTWDLDFTACLLDHLPWCERKTFWGATDICSVQGEKNIWGILGRIRTQAHDRLFNSRRAGETLTTRTGVLAAMPSGSENNFPP